MIVLPFRIREWLECDQWPPPTESHLEMFLQGEGTTGSLRRQPGEAHLSYTYDPKEGFRLNFLRGAAGKWLEMA